MIIRILPVQIPKFWETIKFAYVQADELNKEDMPSYFNELLHALLSDKAQCFLSLDDDRTILRVLITRIMTDKITSEKYLFLQCLYSFKTTSEEEWKRGWIFFMDFAKVEQCSYITTNTRNEKLLERAKMFGVKEKYRRFDLKIGGV